MLTYKECLCTTDSIRCRTVLCLKQQNLCSAVCFGSCTSTLRDQFYIKGKAHQNAQLERELGRGLHLFGSAGKHSAHGRAGEPEKAAKQCGDKCVDVQHVAHVPWQQMVRRLEVCVAARRHHMLHPIWHTA